jgi:asparagine synthase (glutamine-hydrolysing)
MPGIVGLITNRPRHEAERQLLDMVSSLQHEAFYNSGTWINEELGVYVGWVARKGSFSDGMPLFNERKDVALVFAGEDYQEPELAAELKKRGHDLRDDAASYLPHLYEEDRNEFYARLNGRFHGLVIDRTRQVATLFNDRYGMGRLYYHESRDDFYFAAEAKALLAVCPELRKASVSGLAEFVSHGCVLENKTLFESVNVLPAGSAWVFKSGNVRKDSYFDPEEWEQQETLTPDQYYHELKQTFVRILPRYFAGREKIGMSLTGGLDTRMIMAWPKFLPGQLPCYSFGGTFRECQDVLLARKVAATVGQPHQVIEVGEDFLNQFPRYVERALYLTDGCVEPNRSPDLYVNERAAQIAPVRMTGNYGGEVLRRVRAFKPVQPAAGLFVPDFLDHIDKAKEVYNRQVPGHPLSFAVFKQAPWHHYGLQALEQTQLALRSPYLDNEFVKTVFRAPASATLSNETSLRLIEDGNPALRRIRTDFGVAAEGGIVPAGLVRQYMTFTFKAEYAYDYGMPQWIARIDHLLAPLRLERVWLGRHKFCHFRVWYRDALSKYVQETLLDPLALSRSYLDRKTVEAVVRSHVKGERNHTTAIHKLLSLELIHRLFVDQRLHPPAAATTLKVSNGFAEKPVMSRS